MLVERTDVLETTSRAVCAARAGNGGVLIVSGVPGSGRSAVLAATIDAATRGSTDLCVLSADATMAERDFPFGVLQQLIRPLVTAAPEEAVRRWFSGTAELVRPMFLDEPGPDPRETPDTVLPGLHALVVNLAEERPVLLAIDDLQWTDRTSLRALGYLARRLPDSPVLMATTVADDYPIAEPELVGDILTLATHTVHVTPLSAGGVRAVVADEYGLPCEPGFARACHAVTAGNPAALLAVVRGLQDADVRPVEAEAGTVAARGHALLRERRLFYLSTQPETARDAARALVVLGELATPELVAEVAGLDSLECKQALHALDRLGLLAATEPPRLVHPSVQVAVEAAMPVDERERMHRYAAMCLHDAGFSAEQVAGRLLGIGSGYQRWETDLLRSAASAALGRGADEQAARYLRRALLAGPASGAERAWLLVDLATAERGTDPASAVGHVAQALGDLSAGHERAAAVLAAPFALAGHSPAIAVLLRAGVDAPDPVVRDQYPDLALRLEARGRALDLDDPHRLAAAVQRLRALDATASPEGALRPELLAVLLHAVTISANGTASDPALSAGRVAALGTEILDLTEPDPAHVHTALPRLITALLAAGAGDAAGHWLDRVRERANQQPPGVLAALNAERAAVACATGSLTVARSLAASALEAAGSSWPEATAMATTTLTTVALHTQDADLATRVLRTERDATDPRLVSAHLMLRGLLDALRGDLVAALDKMLDCGERLACKGWTSPATAPWRIWAAALHHRLGDTDAAIELADREHAAATAWGAPHLMGRASRLRGMLTAGEDGVAALRLAVRQLRADPAELAKATALLGRRLTALGEPDAAEVSADAERIARGCGAVIVEENKEVEFNGPVLRLTIREQAELTRTQQKVVSLVLLGHTNQDIADLLGITRRAVEKSLTGTYRKLGIAGRTELIAHYGSRNSE
jgi:DNA-binding CsgD family transcriptional regulator